MGTHAFVIGFFTALGWFSAQKMVSTFDTNTKPLVKIEQTQTENKETK